MEAHMNQSEKLQRTLRDYRVVVGRIRLRRLASLTRGVRLSAEDMRRAVADMERTLVMPPGPQIDADIVEVTEAGLLGGQLSFHSYTREEGPSDLSLELSVVDSDADPLEVAIEGLHVR